MPWTPVSRCGGDGPSTNEIDDWQLRWFDHTLKGIDTGVLDSSGDGVHPRRRMARPRRVAALRHRHRGLVHPLGQGRANSKFGDGTLDRRYAARRRAARHLRLRPRRAHSQHGRPFVLLRHHHTDGPGRPAPGRGVAHDPRVHVRASGGRHRAARRCVGDPARGQHRHPTPISPPGCASSIRTAAASTFRRASCGARYRHSHQRPRAA